jgi:hypothetical protein
VGPRTGLDYVEKRKFLPVPGVEFRPLGRPSCIQSLYRLRYPVSCPRHCTEIKTWLLEADLEVVLYKQTPTLKTSGTVNV